MKKVLVVCPLDKLKTHEKDLKQCQVIGFRGTDEETGKDVFFKNNLEGIPADRVSIEFDEVSGEVIIRAKLNQGDFLALGDGEGLMVKQVVKSNA